MTSPYFVRRLRAATVCVWALSALAVAAESGNEPLRLQAASVRQVEAGQRDRKMREGIEAMFQGKEASRRQEAGEPLQQWAALSPEQRERLRDQVREHRQRQREEHQVPGAEGLRRDAPGWRNAEPPPQRLSPEDREEFRQWMRERRGRSGRERNN